VLALGVGVFPGPADAGRQAGSDRAVLSSPLPEVKEPAKNDPVKPADQKDLIVSGRVLDPEGKPAAKADVALLAWPKAPLRGELEASPPKIVAQGKADAQGRFRLTVPGVPLAGFWNPSIVARASGFALGQAVIDPDAEKAEVEVQLNTEQPV